MPKNESLERVIHRVIRDKMAVGEPVTARGLALAVALAGWKHPTAKITDRNEPDLED